MNTKAAHIFWLLFFCSFVFLVADVYAQKKGKKVKKSYNTKVGEKYFENEEYYEAAQSFQKAIREKKGDVTFSQYMLGESYRSYFDYLKAETAYRQVVESGSNEYPLAPFWYAIMLKTNGKYKEAKEAFEMFESSFSPRSEEDKVYLETADLEKRGAMLALEEFKKPARNYEMKVLPAPVNSETSDYAPVIMMHDTAIVITSARGGGSGGNNTDPRSGEMFSDNFRFIKEGNDWIPFEVADRFDEIVNTELNDGAGVFNDDNSKYYFTSCAQADVCNIYVTEMRAGKWRPATMLNGSVNVSDYASKQPALSKGGDTLFFVSDRPGGKGQNDIWYVTKTGDGEAWQGATNLESVNTSYIDMSPCYYDDLEGERVLFFSSNGRESFGGLDIFMARGASFDNIVNAGLPFNSNRDDFYFVLGKEIGYLSSNREGGKGSDDIYRFNTQSAHTVIATISQDSVSGYESISIAGKLLEDDTRDPAQDVTMAISDDNHMKLKTTKTNKDGEFRFDNLSTDQSYNVELNEDNPIISNKSNYYVDSIRVMGSDQVASRTPFENIYFDFDKYNLRPEAVKVLNELVTYANKHPEAQIEMSANTDAIGSTDYNKKLSEKRGNTAKKFLTDKGIDETQIVVTAQGEKNPIAPNTSETGRQLNRRVEFYIVGGPGYQAKAMAVVMQPGASLSEVASKFGMTVEEVKDLNNLNDGQAKTYQPLRVRNTGNGDIIAPSTMAASTMKQSILPQPLKLKKGESYYTVAPGNTLYSISKIYSMTVDELKGLNKLKNNYIRVGQKLKVKELSN